MNADSLKFYYIYIFIAQVPELIKWYQWLFTYIQNSKLDL